MGTSTTPTPATRHLTVAGVVAVVVGVVTSFSFTGVPHNVYGYAAAALALIGGVVAGIGKSLTDDSAAS